MPILNPIAFVPEIVEKHDYRYFVPNTIIVCGFLNASLICRQRNTKMLFLNLHMLFFNKLYPCYRPQLCRFNRYAAGALANNRTIQGTFGTIHRTFGTVGCGAIRLFDFCRALSWMTRLQVMMMKAQGKGTASVRRPLFMASRHSCTGTSLVAVIHSAACLTSSGDFTPTATFWMTCGSEAKAKAATGSATLCSAHSSLHACVLRSTSGGGGPYL
mmetsp:Transcript_4744/g.8122  ORF Transcript_4744/g.8122 Transcript_4744/m.8122 type:complete len:215 (+) Transcript_4744:78-722(+)